MRNALHVAAKDLRLRLRDRSALLAVFVIPLAMASIISLAFAELDAKTPAGRVIRLAFATEDVGPGGVAIARTFEDAPLRDIVQVHAVASEPEVRELVDNGQVDVGLYVPATFSADVIADRAQLGVIEGAGRVVQNAVVNVVADAILAQATAARMSVATAFELDPNAELESLIDAAAADRMPVEVRDSVVAGRRTTPAAYFGPSMAIVSLFFTVGFAGKSLWFERREGLVNRLKATPATLRQIVVGKALGAAALALGGVTVMWTVMNVGFSASWGPPAFVIALLLAMTLSALGLTVFVAAIARSEARTDGLTMLIVFMCALIGGNFVPFQRLPRAMDVASIFTPNGWALRGFLSLHADGAALSSVAPSLLAMVAIGVAFGALGLARMEVALR
jgi:ABC-2 type transport system permease protein